MKLIPLAVVIVALILGAAGHGGQTAGDQGEDRAVENQRTEEPVKGALRVLAPPRGCWQVSWGRTDILEGGSHQGCGIASIPFDPADEFEAWISIPDSNALFSLGATLIVDGEVVRLVRPKLVGGELHEIERHGVRVRYGREVPEKPIVIRIDADPDNCWSAGFDITRADAIESVERTERGCGTRDISLGDLSILGLIVERNIGTGNWPLFVAIERDGQVVQTYGPDTGVYRKINGFHSVPREVEDSGEPPGPLP